jgi:hypothetical protein
LANGINKEKGSVLKILFIRGKYNRAGEDHSTLYKKLLKESEIEVLEYLVPTGHFFVALRSIYRINKLRKEHQINLIHCFDEISGKLAVLSGNGSKTVVSLFESSLRKWNYARGRWHKLTRKICIRISFKVVLLDSDKCYHYLLRSPNYQVMATSLIRNTFFPIKKNRKKENKDYMILFLVNDTIQHDDFDVVLKAVSIIEEVKVKMISHNVSDVSNDLLNSADLIITSLDSKSILEGTEKVLLANKQMISLKNNHVLTHLSRSKNLKFSGLNAYYICKKIKLAMESPSVNSRALVLRKKDETMVKNLMETYRKNCI